jgi:hypothetical protein
METTYHPEFVSAPPRVRVKTASLKATAFWDYLEESRFGMTPVFLTLAACFGGFAAAVTVQYSILMLCVVGLATGLVEVLLIAVAPMRITFWFLVAALMIDFFVFIF